MQCATNILGFVCKKYDRKKGFKSISIDKVDQRIFNEFPINSSILIEEGFTILQTNKKIDIIHCVYFRLMVTKMEKCPTWDMTIISFNTHVKPFKRPFYFPTMDKHSLMDSSVSILLQFAVGSIESNRIISKCLFSICNFNLCFETGTSKHISWGSKRNSPYLGQFHQNDKQIKMDNLIRFGAI